MQYKVLDCFFAYLSLENYIILNTAVFLPSYIHCTWIFLLFSDCLPFSCSFKCNRNPHIDFSSSRKTKNQKKNKKKGRVGKNKKKYATHKRNKKTSRPNEVWQQRLFTDGKRR